MIHPQISLLTGWTVYWRLRSSHRRIEIHRIVRLIVMIHPQTSLLTVPIVKLLPRTSLLIGWTAYWRLRTSHCRIEIHRIVRPIVLVARLMCQSGRLSALIATHLQTALRLSDLTAW